MDMDSTPDDFPPDLISRPEAGRILGVGPQAVDGLLRSGELRAWRIGARVKLSMKEVLAYRLRADGWIPVGRER
jgi:excisionase family DNA binding protein